MAEARSGVCVRDVAPHDFIVAYADHLKRTGKIAIPKWSDIAKTAHWKEVAPYDPDWYYIRAASMARKLYLRGPVGVGSFNRIYGGAKNRGTRPSRFAKASGSITRSILQQLEKIDVVERTQDGMRRISIDGQRDLDRIAGSVVYGA